jgi:diadenosine tetraphosphate (Ap4A) HIT family hydrolase
MTDMDASPKEWMPRERWQALVRGDDCPLCQVIQSTDPGDEFAIAVAQLRLSRLNLSRNQFVPGYCTLICTKHVREPYELTEEEQALFFGDMMRAGRALERVFNPVKMNFQILGNAVPHLHAHIVPRYYGDSAPSRPIDPGARTVQLSAAKYAERIRQIRLAL